MTAHIDTCGSSAPPLDPRVRRTRRLLQDALHSLLGEKRFSAITVQDIAARATVNRATFYAHYVDKQALAADVLRTALRNAVLAQFNEHPALTRENLVRLAVAVFEFVGSAHQSCPKMAAELQDTVGAPLQEELYDIIEEWLSQSVTYIRLFPGCAKSTVAVTLSCSIHGGAHRWSRSIPRPPAEQVGREIISILLPIHKP